MKTLILKILPLILVMVWAGHVQAQTIGTTAGTVTNCPGLTVVPVTVTNCNGVGAISLVVSFSNTNLTFAGYQNLNSALSVGMLIINSTANKVYISWVNTTPANVGNGTLVELKFTGTPGVSTLTWDTQTPGNCEYTDVNGTILPSAYTSGSATVNSPPVISVQPVDKTALVGQNTSFTVTASGAGIAYLWQISTNGGGLWSDLANNATYSNVTGSTLYLNNALLTYNGYKYRCRLTGTCTPVVNTNEVTLTVIDPVTTTLPAASHCPGNIVVPVTVTNFTGVAAFSMVFAYNASCLTYTGYQTLNGSLSGGTFVANATGGRVYMSWSSAAPATIGNGTIVELLFTASTGTSSLAWDLSSEGNCEYATISGSLITSVFVNGNETIYGLPAVTVQPVNKTVANGQNTTFGVTATGSGLAYRWQVSTDGGGIFADLNNGGYYSNVTAATMNITGAPLSLSTCQYRCRVSGTCSPSVNSSPAVLTVLPNIISTLGTVTVCPGQVIVPVNVTDFIGVASFSLAVQYNPAILTYTGTQSLNPALSAGTFGANASGGKVYLTWSNISAATIASGGLLINLVFTGVSGSSALSWDTQTPGNCEYTDLNGLVIFATWNAGNVTVNLPPAITVQPVNKTIYGSGSTSFSVSATGTGLGYIWQVSTNGGGVWTNLTNTAPYSGVTTPTLTINPATTGMNGYQYHCIVSGSCTPSVTSGPGILTVTQTAITTFSGAVTASCTGNLSIPVNVVNCSNVAGISLTMTFDTTKMSFEGYHSVNSLLNGGLLAVNRSGNKVIMSWASTSVVNIGSGVLLQYRFRASAGISTTLNWDTQTPGACEYVDLNGTLIAALYNSSNITVAANALIVNAGPDTTMQFSSIQLDGTATGATMPYTWLWAPAGSLSNPAIPNPVASPAVTTTYTLTVTAGNGCSGSDVVTVTAGTIPTNLTLQDITVSDGESFCYNALQVITVAGGGSYFTVQPGGSAIMIAGQKISYLYGTRVYAGGYMHGYITTSAQYCNSLPPPMVATAIGEPAPDFVESKGYRVFPNPTTGNFAVMHIGESGKQEPVQIIVYGSFGEIIGKGEFDGSHTKGLSLAGKPAGLYFMRITGKNGDTVLKIVKQ